MLGSRAALTVVVTCSFCLLACAPAQPAAPKPVAPPASSARAKLEPSALSEEAEPPAPLLRTGRIAPVEHAEQLTLKVRRHALDGEEQLLEVPLPELAQEVPGDSFWWGAEVRLTGSSAPFQLVSRGKGTEMVLWLRRPKAEAAGEVAGDAYTPALGSRPGHHFRFRAAAPSGALSAELVPEWATAAIDYLVNQTRAFGVAASARLQARYKLASKPGGLPFDRPLGGAGSELVELMDTFSARSSVQEALATYRSGVLTAAKQPRTLPIGKLKGPQLTRHPWADLSKRLGGKQPEEPLAKAVPAEFYFVRAKSFSAFTQVLAAVESFGAPAADLLDRVATERGTLPRYLAELGVETGDLSRVLGPEVVDDFALVGSDPYVHEGSDVTLVFHLKSPLLFRAALLKSLSSHGAAHGGTQTSSFNHEGVTVEVARSPDGRVRQHHAVVGDLELVSNSPAAIKRVISTISGKAPRLADELDFRYMLARDADVPAELLAFIGDRFVEHVVGPAQKLAELRRQIALVELSAAPTAALLYGWIHGKSPSDLKQLLRSGLLAPGELKHQDGPRIDWTPGSAPRSTWGTPAALEPLIDLPAVTKVSPAESEAYARFAENYQFRWSQYIDPIALRISSARRGEGTSFHAEMRVLPLVPQALTSRFDLGDDGRVAPSELATGARLSIGIGEQAEVRRGLAQALTLFTSHDSGLKLDWLGDYALVGCADRSELLVATHRSREARELPIERPPSQQDMSNEAGRVDDLDVLTGLPVYAVIGLRSRIAAAVALTGLKRMAESAAPGAFEWAPFATHHGVEVVRILARERASELAVYYALAGDAFIITLNRSVIRSLIDEAQAGKLPLQGKRPAALAKEGQVVFELAPNKKGSLRSLLGWALSVSSVEAARTGHAVAEAVLRGVPESAHKPERSAELSRAYLGLAPLTPDGRRYFLAADGIADPLRGTAHAPEWPAVPTPESSTQKVLSSLGRIRSDFSFDNEPPVPAGNGATTIPTHRPTAAPPLRSLRARLDLLLR